MSYPYGNPSNDFQSGVYDSDFSPTQTCAGLINAVTPVSNIGIKNSIGHQLSLMQNFVNETYIGRSGVFVEEAWLRRLYSSGIILDALGGPSYIHIEEDGSSRGNFGYKACVAADPYSVGICSTEGIIQFGNPTSIDMTISGGMVGILTNTPSCALDVSGEMYLHTVGGDGIAFTGDNMTINRITCYDSDVSQLVVSAGPGNESSISLNGQDIGGTLIGNKLYVTGDDDVWTYDPIQNFTSGVIVWSDCDISGFSAYT